MSIIGWLFCVAVLIVMSISNIITAFINLGRYNIGGVPNKPMTKIYTLVFIAFNIYCWTILFSYAPFTIGMK